MLVGLVVSFPGWAINVGEITSIMTSAESSLSKEITNTTDAARYVSVSVKQLSSPLAGSRNKTCQFRRVTFYTCQSYSSGQAKDVFASFIKDLQMISNVIIVCNG